MTFKQFLELTVLYPVTALVILMGVAIVIPSRHHCVQMPRAMETAAVATLRNISYAQDRFKALAVADVDGDGAGEYGTFRELSASAPVRGTLVHGTLDPPTLSPAFRNPRPGGEVFRNGYFFRIFLPDRKGKPCCPDAAETSYSQVDPDRAEKRWFAFAWPEGDRSVGTNRPYARTFFIDETGEVQALHPAELAKGWQTVR